MTRIDISFSLDMYSCPSRPTYLSMCLARSTYLSPSVCLSIYMSISVYLSVVDARSFRGVCIWMYSCTRIGGTGISVHICTYREKGRYRYIYAPVGAYIHIHAASQMKGRECFSSLAVSSLPPSTRRGSPSSIACLSR